MISSMGILRYLSLPTLSNESHESLHKAFLLGLVMSLDPAPLPQPQNGFLVCFLLFSNSDAKVVCGVPCFCLEMEEQASPQILEHIPWFQ